SRLVRDYFQHLAQSGLSSDENLNGNLHMLSTIPSGT
ncbi:MAG: hypothetical protein D084_Lepto4C00014G0002, partial [Leptospirillum sp. Group IV 'UBA BS']